MTKTKRWQRCDDGYTDGEITIVKADWPKGWVIKHPNLIRSTQWYPKLAVAKDKAESDVQRLLAQQAKDAADKANRLQAESDRETQTAGWLASSSYPNDCPLSFAQWWHKKLNWQERDLYLKKITDAGFDDPMCLMDDIIEKIAMLSSDDIRVLLQRCLYEEVIGLEDCKISTQRHEEQIAS